MQAYGEDIAILAGDALLSLSFEYIARETQDVDPERVLRVSISLITPGMTHPSCHAASALAMLSRETHKEDLACTTKLSRRVRQAPHQKAKYRYKASSTRCTVTSGTLAFPFPPALHKQSNYVISDHEPLLPACLGDISLHGQGPHGLSINNSSSEGTPSSKQATYNIIVIVHGCTS